MALVLHVYLCPQQHKFLLLDCDHHPPAVEMPCYVGDCTAYTQVRRTLTQSDLADIALEKILSGQTSIFGR